MNISSIFFKQLKIVAVVVFLCVIVAFLDQIKATSRFNLKVQPQGSNIFWKSEECSSLRLTLTVDIAEVVTEL